MTCSFDLEVIIFSHRLHRLRMIKNLFRKILCNLWLFSYLCSQMQKSDKIINIILALVALGLLALCIASVRG